MRGPDGCHRREQEAGSSEHDHCGAEIQRGVEPGAGEDEKNQPGENAGQTKSGADAKKGRFRIQRAAAVCRWRGAANFGDAEVGLAVLTFHQLTSHVIRHGKKLPAGKIRANQLYGHSSVSDSIIGRLIWMLEILPRFIEQRLR